MKKSYVSNNSVNMTNISDKYQVLLGKWNLLALRTLLYLTNVLVKNA